MTTAKEKRPEALTGEATRKEEVCVRVEGERRPGFTGRTRTGLRTPASTLTGVAAALVEGERAGGSISRGEQPRTGSDPISFFPAPLVEKAPADSTGESPLTGRETGMKPIAAFLPTWRDEITGEALTYDELRRVLCEE